MDVQTGTLYFRSGGEWDGQFSAATGAAIRFAGGTFTVGQPVFSGDDIQFTGGVVDIGGGEYTENLQFTGGSIQISAALARELTIDGPSVSVVGDLVGTLNVLGGSTLSLSPGSVLDGTLNLWSQLASPLTVAANSVFNWHGGYLVSGAALTVATNGVLNIGGDVRLYSPLVNEGTINWTNGTVTVNNNGSSYTGVISNRVGAVWDVQCDNYGLHPVYGAEEFINEGTLRKSAGTGASHLYLNLINNGVVDAQSGAIQLTYGLSLTNGVLSSTLRGYGQYGWSYLGGNPLGGIVGATLADGFKPQVGDQFDLVQYGSLSGNFSGVELPPGIVWETNVGANAFSILALNNAPEIDPVGDQAIDELQPVSLSIPGHDWDLENPKIIGISIPANSMDASCYPLNDNLWDVAAPAYPLNITNGIGYLVSDASISDFTLHDHVYLDAYVPDPTRAVVTYEFDQPLAVSGIDIVQHYDGITEIEGFAGDSLLSMTSVGSVYSPAGQANFVEGETSTFTFSTPVSGKYFRFIIRSTSDGSGYAAYRAYPLATTGERIRPAHVQPDELVYSLLSGPSEASINPTNGLFSWTPTESQGNSSNVIQVIVRDNGLPELFATNTFSIGVNEINMAPVLGTIGNKSVNEGSALSFTATATDADLPANTLIYSLIGAPTGASIGSSSGAFSWTPTEVQGGSNYTFTVRVTDSNPTATNSKNLTDEESVTVTVNEINVAPVLGAIGNKSINEGAELSFTATATDADLPANSLTYSLIGAPTGAMIGSSSGAFSWTPTEAQGAGNYTFTVRVTDSNPTATNSKNLADDESITVTVNEINVAPVLGAIGNKSINEGAELSFTATATDADLPANSLTYSLIGAPTGAMIGSSSGAFSWTPTEAQGAGNYTFTVRVTDSNPTATNSKNLADDESITVAVIEVNSTPILTVPENQTMNELTSLIMTNMATDVDLPVNVLQFDLLTPISGMALDTNTGVIVWTPTEEQGPSTNMITVRVYDNGLPMKTATNSFIITVNEVNSVPVLTVPTNQTINELTMMTFTNSATDADLPVNLLRYQLLSPIDGMTVDANTGVIAWMPIETQGNSTNTITVRVYDSGIPILASTNSFVLTVNEINVAPVLGGIGNKSVNEGSMLSFTAMATDGDLPTNSLTYSLIDAPTGATIGSGSGEFSWTPTEVQGPSNYTFTVRVTDSNPTATNSKNLTDDESISVTVNEINVAPVLGAIGNKSINEGAELSFTATATDVDLPSNSLSYMLIGAPTGATIGSSSGAFSWTPTEAQGPSNYTFMVHVTDSNPMATNSKNLTDDESITVTVNEVNVAPVLTVPSDLAIHAMEPIELQASVTDTDLPANTLSFELVSGPSGLLVSSAGVITWTPTSALIGQHEVRIKAIDNGTPAQSDEESFFIEVSDECRILDIITDGELIQIDWSTISGKVYQVQSTTNLLNNSWLDLSLPKQAFGPETSETNTTDTSSTFYRIQILP